MDPAPGAPDSSFELNGALQYPGQAYISNGGPSSTPRTKPEPRASPRRGRTMTVEPIGLADQKTSSSRSCTTRSA